MLPAFLGFGLAHFYFQFCWYVKCLCEVQVQGLIFVIMKSKLKLLAIEYDVFLLVLWFIEMWIDKIIESDFVNMLIS